MLGLTNKKPGPDRDTYVAERNAVLRFGANLVEIDLLRMYGRLPVAAVGPCEDPVLVARPADLPAVAAWPVQLCDRLPTVPVPLAGDDPDVPLDLQAVLCTRCKTSAGSPGSRTAGTRSHRWKVPTRRGPGRCYVWRAWPADP